MIQILLNYLYIFVLPLLFGALLRLIAGRWKHAWLVSPAALLLAAALVAYASTNPIPGSEGPGIRALQALCLLLGTQVSDCILLFQR